MTRIRRIHIVMWVLISVFLLFGIARAVNPEPGSDEDPLVAKSYVDQQIALLQNQIASISGAQDGETAGSVSFKVVELSDGQILTAGQGTEIILRVGTATAISGENGDGLADVTSGLGTKHDLKTGQTVPVNHLLVVSRNDGRGLKAENRVILLVKGPYSIN